MPFTELLSAPNEQTIRITGGSQAKFPIDTEDTGPAYTPGPASDRRSRITL